MLLIDPDAVTDVIGFGLLAVVLLLQKLWAPQSTMAGGSEHVTRAQFIALTLIAAALVVGTVLYGVLRIYAA